MACDILYLMKPASKQIATLRNRLVELAHLQSANALLQWDMAVNLPPKAGSHRAETLSHLSTLVHNHFLAIDSDNLLTKLKHKLDKKELTPREAVIVSETWRQFDRARKLPSSFIREQTLIIAETHRVWEAARAQSSFKLFQPNLEKIIDLKRKEARFIGFTKTPYDPLLDMFEPGMKTEETAMLFHDLKGSLIALLKRIQKSKLYKTVKPVQHAKLPREDQKQFSRTLAQKLGFDFSAGLIGESTHPFMISFHPHDTRLTTRYLDTNITYSAFSTIHEVGHALYEQGIKAEHFGTPLGEAISTGIHESQSRMWENIIGKSLPFWQHFYPELTKMFPVAFKKGGLPEFHRSINRVAPTLIRTEADEVTYNLHIIIRFEIERDLIEGTIAVGDVPKIWNEKIKEYLSITVPNDTLGVLQDVHWGDGLFGYFPTYAFGNLYAAQFYNAARRSIPRLHSLIQKGNFTPLLTWLRSNIHVHGKFYSAGGLIREVTGKELSSGDYIDYLTEKYTKLYRL